MKTPREEWRREIQEILAKQQQLRNVLDELSGRVQLLQGKIDHIGRNTAPEPAIPAVPAVEEIKEEASKAEEQILPPPLPVLPAPVVRPEPRAEAVPPRPSSDSIPGRAGEKSSLEFKLGTYWLVRIGVVMFLAALVFAGNYAYENIVSTLGPATKVGLLYVVGALLAGAGAWMERRGGKMLNYSRVLFAGGLSAIYYITYAAHYVPRLRVIESPVLAGALLLAWAGVMAWIADRRKSQTLAVLSVLLAYFTSSITPMAGFTLFSNFVLTAAAVFFFIRHRWAVISWVGLAGTYASFGYWRAMGLVDRGGFEGFSESPWMLLAILSGYWIVFTAATFSRPGRESGGAQKITFLTANNTAFFAYGCLLLPGPDFLKFWQWAMGFGALLLGLSAWAGRLAPEETATKNAYFSQGLLLVTVGLIAYFEGQSLALVMAMESVFLLVSGTRGKNPIARLGAYATAAAAVLVESWVLLDRPGSGEYTAAAICGFLLFNAWWVRNGLAAERQAEDDGGAWVLTAGALWVGLLGTWVNAAADFRPVLLSLEAVGLCAVFYRLRMREAVLAAQVFWLAAFGGWLVWEWNDHRAVPVAVHLAVLGGALALGHAWKWIPFGRSLFTSCCLQAVYALGVVAVLGGWILPGRSLETVVMLTAGLALLLLAYGALTRAWFVAGFGQVFLWTSAACSIFLDTSPRWNWMAALLPIAELVAIRRGTPFLLSFFGIQPGTAAAAFLKWVGRFYEVVGFVLGWIWLARYVPEDWRTPAYLASGFVLFLLGTVQPPATRSFEDRLLLVFAGLFAVVGWGCFISDGRPGFQNLPALLLIPLSEVLARRKQSLAGYVLVVLVFAGVIALLFYATRFTALHLSANYWTAAWGLLAGLVFGAGFLLKHHWYRWAGLGLLALAIGRVGVVDIWRFETIYRILSLFVLSGLAIGLGFLYTKYQEKMKEWL